VTVRELIAKLESMNPGARVLIAAYPEWPSEIEIAGVVERKHIEESDRDVHWEPDDVLLLEGDKVGFGSRFAWNEAVGASEVPRD